MKKITALLIVVAMILSLAACGAPAETAQTETAPTVQASETPTEEPTPTPTPEPTEEPLTEEEMMYLEWLHYSNTEKDIYANMLLMDAYENGKLDELIEEGKISSDELEPSLKINNYLMSTGWDRNYILYGTEDPSKARGEPERILVFISKGSDAIEFGYQDINSMLTAIDYPISMGYTYTYAFPEEEQTKIREMLNLYDNLEDEQNMKLFDERIMGDYLDPVSKFYFISYVTGYNIVKTNKAPDKKITFNGQEMMLSDYGTERNLYYETIENCTKYLAGIVENMAGNGS